MFKTGLVEDLPLHDTGFIQRLYVISFAQVHTARGVEALRLLMFVPGALVEHDLSALQPEQVLLLAVLEEDFPKQADADGD